MKKLIVALSLLVSILPVEKLKAQADTLFWFAAPWVTPDSWWRDNLGFHISTYSNTTTVRIKQPASAFDTVVVVPPYSTFDKYFNYMIDSLENKPANKLLCRGFKISSDNPITVVYDELSRSPNFFNTETYSLKGKAALGTNFITPFQTTYSIQTLGSDLNGDATITQSYSQFNIVASQDSTTIWITPKCNIVGHSAGITFSVFIPGKGMSYTCQDVSQQVYLAANNLSGSIITSNKPIAVTVSDDSVRPGGGGCYDLIGDQIVPVENLGTNYIAQKGNMYLASNESVFIVGTQNATTLTINDGSLTTYTLNAGDTKNIILTQSLTYIQSTSNVYALHVSGNGCEIGSELLSPITCFGTNQVNFFRKRSDPLYANIYCQAGALNSFTLNGNASLITASSFSLVPGTAGMWYGATFNFNTTTIPANSSNLIANSAGNFGISFLNGNFTNGVSFHHNNPFPIKSTILAGPSQTICSSTNTISLNGTVSGAIGTGIWSSSGTGTFSNNTNLNTTYSLSVTDLAQTQIKFYLSSTGSCISTKDSVVLNINATPFVILSILQPTLCLNSAPISLIASPPGGTYTSTMVTGGLFYPNAIGTHSITYSFTDINGCSSSDTKTISVSPCTGINSMTENSFVTVYPNPAKDVVQIMCNSTPNANFVLLDVSGRLIIGKTEFQGSHTLNMEKLSSGLYYLVVTTGRTQQTIKLTKQ